MKNPLMSLWLSGANRAAGIVRGAAMAEATRMQKTALRQMLSPATSTAPTRPAKPKRRKTRRT